MPRRLFVLLSLLALVLALLPTAASGQTPRAGVIPDQFIVVLQPGVSARAEAQAAERTYGLRLLYVYEHAIKGFAFKGSSQAAQALARNPKVRFVSQDRTVRAVAQPVPTGVARIAADQNPTAGIDGVDRRVNVNVAILDTGIDATHPDLNVAGGTDCTGAGTSNDGHGHGTHVAGTAAALDNDFGVVGVAPGARLWAVKVLDDSGSGTWSSVTCGVDWVTATRTDGDPSNDVAVVNMSLAGPGTDDGNCGNANADTLHQAICGSVARGVVYVVAAGNANADAAGSVPAAYDEVLTVSAIADSDGKPGGLGPATFAGADDTQASFSNYGADVDVAAPGVDIWSTYKGGAYSTMSGTSMASPHVAGVVALYVANNGPASTAAGVATIRQNLTDPAKGYSVAQSDPKGFTGDKDSAREPLAYPVAGTTISTHDVAVAGLTAPASLLQGQSASISANVANPGTFAETFTVTLTDTTAGATIGSQSVSLAAGASTTLAFTWATSSATSAGNHVLTAAASQVTSETNTANNSKSATVTVNQPVNVDRAVTGITAPASIGQGESTTVQVTAANLGSSAESFAVTLRDATAGVNVGSQTVSLAAGASTTLAFPWATTSAAAGPHTLTATVATGAGETNTANNSKSATTTVTGLMHVGDLDAASSRLSKGAWKAIVTITVFDGNERTLGGATVSGTFRQGTWSRAVACTTGANGRCSVDSGRFPSSSRASFAVDNLAQAGLTYTPAANHDPDGDSNGTTIAISK